MCSIMGYCSRSAAFDVFMKEFEKTISSGPDDRRKVNRNLAKSVTVE